MSILEKVFGRVILEKAGIPKGMFGIDKGMVKPYMEKD